MLTPERGGRAPSGHRGGMGGRRLCRGDSWGTHSARSALGWRWPRQRCRLRVPRCRTVLAPSPGQKLPQKQDQKCSRRASRPGASTGPNLMHPEMHLVPSPRLLIYKSLQSAPRNFKLLSPPSPSLHTLPIQPLQGPTWEPGWGHDGHHTTVDSNTGAGRSTLLPLGFPSSSTGTSNHLKREGVAKQKA